MIGSKVISNDHYTQGSPSDGGVYVGSGTFTKQSGTIYGSNAGDLLKNTAGNGNGHGVYVNTNMKRTTTAGPGVTLDSRISGARGGWE